MVTNFSEWLPMYTLCEMLGIDEKDWHKISTLDALFGARAIYYRQSRYKSEPWFIMRFLWNIRQCSITGKVLQDRRKNPRDDLLTVIAAAEVDGEPMVNLSMAHGC